MNIINIIHHYCNDAVSFFIYFQKYSCEQSCPCRLEENHKIDGINLGSLEEVEIIGFTDSDEQMELVELLSFNAEILQRLVISYTMAAATKKVCEMQVRSMCHPNVEVEFSVFREPKRVPFDWILKV